MFVVFLFPVFFFLLIVFCSALKSKLSGTSDDGGAGRGRGRGEGVVSCMTTYHGMRRGGAGELRTIQRGGGR